MKKAIIYIGIMMVLPLLGLSQMYQSMPNFYRPIDSSAIEKANQREVGDVDFSMNVGTGFSSFSGNGMMNSYIAPSVDYKVSSDLTLNFSGMISNLNPVGSSGPVVAESGGGMMPLSSNNHSFGISAGGVFQPTNKLYIRAQGEYAENATAPFSLYPNPVSGQSNDYKSVSLGMGYQINEKTSIGFEFRYSDGYHSPYNPYSSYNGYNMMHRRNPWW